VFLFIIFGGFKYKTLYVQMKTINNEGIIVNGSD